MISAYSFGKIRINNIWYTGDLKISAGVVLPDWWRKSGHVCGLGDIQDLLRVEIEVLILGKGKPGMMRADQELRRFLEQQGVRLIEQPTAEAVVTFNNLYRKKRVGAGFHLTC
ncbi:MAG TPA: hypothetical protein ENK96_07100 [Desulfobulbaceae bacterium]|nr:hypothetical protein [Desulfobulbaceae bacterium]